MGYWNGREDTLYAEGWISAYNTTSTTNPTSTPLPARGRLTSGSTGTDET